MEHIPAVILGRVSLRHGDDRSTSPLELLTGIRARNEAEANIISGLQEPIIPENPHTRLAILGALRDEWSEKMEDAKRAVSSTVLRDNINVGDRVLVWSHKERTGRGTKLNPCWIGPAMLTWKGDMGGCEVLFAETGKKSRVNISKVKKYWQ